VNDPRLPPMRLSPSWFLLAAMAVAMPMLLAQEASAQETVVPKRSVRTGYAQVLRVEPIYQTLTATRMEQRCDGEVVPPKDKPRGLSRIVGAVKEALGSEEAAAGPALRTDADCETVPVERKFRRPIAYDVDYVYKGMKYRSRLPYDPGNRLRVQFSVQPYVPPAESE
jgi:uncharacterized protein YcfJ